jgi:murein DD-endopeptidase MepM/ murein hydrolase activator NlpD
VDLFCAGRRAVLAPFNCTQTRHSNDVTTREVIYLQGDGVLDVFAHVNARKDGTGHVYMAGEVVGYVRSDLRDPHLHWERIVAGRAVHSPTAAGLRDMLCWMARGRLYAG